MMMMSVKLSAAPDLLIVRVIWPIRETRSECIFAGSSRCILHATQMATNPL